VANFKAFLMLMLCVAFAKICSALKKGPDGPFSNSNLITFKLIF